jgi:16S rRNA U516 pseudouridylate synthase RsuA-like enzyme
MGNRGGDAGRSPEIDSENIMSTLTIQMPEGLARQLRECAAREGVTVDQLMSAAAGEKLSALLTVDHLRDRARHAKREDFLAFLNGSPDVPPMPGDEL